MGSDAHIGGSSEQGPLDDVPAEQYEILRHPRRVRLLEVLFTQSRLSVRELTTELIEREAPDAPIGQARHDIRVTLVHNHLPRLADYGLIEWDDDSVELVDEPLLCPTTLSTLLETAVDEKQLLERVVDPARLGLLKVVADHDRPQSLEQLASTLAAREPALPSDTRQVKIALHHSHLPALDEVDVLAYDHRSQLIESTAETESIALVR